MMKIKKLIDQYNSSKIEIFKLFELEETYAFEDYSNYEYFITEHDFYFFYLDQEYSFDYCSKVDKEVEGFALFYIQNDEDRFYAIFDTRKLLTTEQFEQRA